MNSLPSPLLQGSQGKGRQAGKLQPCVKALRSERFVILREGKAPDRRKEEVGWFVSPSSVVPRKENGFFGSPLGRERKALVLTIGGLGNRDIDEAVRAKGNLRGW